MNHKKDISIYDIAKLAQVSPSTVSKVLNHHPCVKQETVARINKIIDETGFQAHWGGRSNNCIGLMLPAHEGLNEDNYSLQIFAHCQEYLAKRNYSIEILCPSAIHLNKKGQCIVRSANSISGVIISCIPSNYEIAKKLLADSDKLPCATIGKFNTDFPKQPGAPNHILADDYNAGVQAATILLRHHQKSIMIVTPQLADIVHAHRKAGIYDTLIQGGFLPKNISQIEIKKDLWNEGLQLASSLACAKNRPDSLIFTNSAICTGFIIGCQALKLHIPEDFSIIGFEDASELQYISPPITVMHTPARQLAESACEAVLAQIEQRSLPTAKLIPHTLIPRQSVTKRALPRS